MPTTTRIVQPGPSTRVVRTSDGQDLEVPANWELLPPGDATLTRRVKAGGPTWTVQEKKGRKIFSKGVWADADRIKTIREDLDAERSTDTYKKKRATDLARKEKKHNQYVAEFREAVFSFLNFAVVYESQAKQLADAVTTHATPVGSGTVARTERIPLEQRAESAVIAWLRHATTAYDEMKIARIKGKRREVRRQLAQQSRAILDSYRRGDAIETQCPLQRALENL
ncbi:MAG: DUF2293 domain-containing protein [Planctomycetaceae bacterium]|jgi:hypothetical protein|nr:DUF2293 domain-containing protein [bacterium]MDB4680080.1 DUF2293 domain-containing protein [Planctomycetaceae bacterium]MDG2388226.1 DUF2293 domain-containing protein [Planctomycetaceae bacterium]